MRWLVGFMDRGADDRRLWTRLLKPGFVHCWASREVMEGVWMFTEWTAGRLTCGLCPPEGIAAAVAGSAEVLIYEADATPLNRAWVPIIPLHHCASITAHLLGVPLGGRRTPWALARALMDRGAIPLPRRAKRSSTRGEQPENGDPIPAGPGAARAADRRHQAGDVGQRPPEGA